MHGLTRARRTVISPTTMNASYFVAALLGLAILASPAAAQPPAPAPTSTQGPRHQVLLLDTFKIVEGYYDRTAAGDYVRQVGKVTEVTPAAAVLFTGESRDQVNRYLVSRAAAGAAPAEKPVTKPSAGGNSVAGKAYPTKIQPIVHNLCAHCHAKPDYAGAFKLKPIPTGFADLPACRANAAAAFAHVNPADPSASDLLAKCLTAHGGQKRPAIHVREHPAYKSLELWAHGMAAPEGSPVPQVVPAAAPAPAPAVFVSAPRPATTATPAKPPAGAPADPFDPAEFNRAPPVKK